MALGLAGDKRRLFQLLAGARGKFVSTDELVEAMWMDAPDGGPETAQKTIAVLICRLRAALDGFAVGIEEKSGRGGRNARLVARWAVARPEGGHGYQLVKVAA